MPIIPIFPMRKPGPEQLSGGVGMQIQAAWPGAPAPHPPCAAFQFQLLLLPSSFLSLLPGVLLLQTENRKKIISYQYEMGQK